VTATSTLIEQPMIHRTRPIALALLIAAGLLAAPGAHSGGSTASKAAKGVACSFGAFVNESDPAGLNVRDQPGTHGKVVGVLPRVLTAKDGADPQARVEVEVRGASNGWFLIANAKDNDALTGKPVRKLYGGMGWVSGKKLTLKSQATQARASASDKGATAFKLHEDNALDNDAMVDATSLVACQGKWAQIEVNLSKLSTDVRDILIAQPAAKAGATPGSVRGWVNHICALQETACSGTE